MRIIVNGAAGFMGREVIAAVERGFRGAEIAARVDAAGGEGIARSFAEVTAEADVIIDFSHHSVVPQLSEYAVSRNIPVVVATTGHTDEELEIIRKTGEKVPVFFSANMSVGVALLVDMARQTAKAFPEADIEIVETHHNRKLDAPSGTALMIADGIKEVRAEAEYKLGRAGNAKREENEIGIHAVRLANVVGKHEVIVATASQTITLKHEAHSRSLFADGALVAADFIKDKAAGLYSMSDLIG